jgi:hypothetical protein
MNRSTLLIPVTLALAVGLWIIAAEDHDSEQPTLPSHEAAAAVTSSDQTQLPLFSDPLALVAEPEAQRDALKRPTLALQARSATDGKNISQAIVTIQIKEQAIEAATYRPGAKRDRGSSTSDETPPNDGSPVSWATDGDGAKKKPSNSPLSLSLSAEGDSSTELDPGDWSVTFEAAGFVSQTLEINLGMGDEESLSASLSQAVIVQGSVQDRFGRALGGSKLLFIPQGRAYPRFPRDLQGIFTTTVDRQGNITPISLPEDDYTIAYGNLGTPKLQTQSRLNAGETNNLEVVFGGKSMVRFELDQFPEEKRSLEVRLEIQDQKKIDREREKQLRNPERANKAREKGKVKETWKAAARTSIREGVGELFNAKPGTYRVTLMARPGEYSSSTMLTLEADESVLVNIQLPVLPERSGPKRNDPKTPTDGPLNISILRNPQSADWKQDGIYWR